MKTTEPTSPGKRSQPGSYGLKVNAFDRTSSILIALLMMVSAAVLGLLIIYFSGRIFSSKVAIPVTAINLPSGPKKPAGMDPSKLPGAENAPDELTPQLESKLNMMAGLIAAQSALLDSDEFDPLASAPKGDGGGDPRQADGNGSGSGPPEPQRELRFEPDSLQDYARWLDSIGTEVGVLGYDNKVYYASQLVQPKPKVRSGDPKDETRLYFNTSGSPLESLDRQLARKAGIASKGSMILQFVTPETQQMILHLERQAAGKRTPDKIRRTVFLVEKKGSKYQFKVDRQEYFL